MFCHLVKRPAGWRTRLFSTVFSTVSGSTELREPLWDHLRIRKIFYVLIESIRVSTKLVFCEVLLSSFAANCQAVRSNRRLELCF